MPVLRTVIARNAGHTLEHITAPPHGSTWGPVHRSPDWRWIMPGTGGVQWRGGEGEQLFVDALTAFHLRRGDSYQLQHERGRSHLVLSTAAPVQRGANARGWLVDLRGLYGLRLAARSASAEPDAALAANAVDRALGSAVALQAQPEPAALSRARGLLVSDPVATDSLSALGEAAHCSPFHLARLFRRHLGLSPQQYRLRLRLAQALDRLEGGERDLAGLAFDLGFASQSHFGALFRREVGVTPAAARAALSART